MDIADKLKDLLADNRTVKLVENDIYSVLSDVSHKHHYDKRATVYDLVVGTRLYNFILWGSSPLDYTAFGRRAIDSHPTGRFLDAGCGSLLFIAPVYLESKRQIIAFDQSLSMLRRARKRLINLAGSMPEHIVLLQADLNDLPFIPSGFDTVLCLNVLHQFENAAELILNFKRLLVDNGHLYLTSLVSNNRFVGDRYLDALYAAGEFVRPRSSAELKEIAEKSFVQKVSCSTKGNMAFIAAAMFP